MAKLSSINKNERRKKLVKKYAGRYAKLKAMANDQSLDETERLMAGEGAKPKRMRRRVEQLPERESAPADAAKWIAVLPLGATEQHGPHLPFETDSLIAEAVVERLIERLPGGVEVEGARTFRRRVGF